MLAHKKLPVHLWMKGRRAAMIAGFCISFCIPVGGRAADLIFYSVTKGRYFHEDAGGAPALRPYQPWYFEARMVFTNASGAFLSANLARPGAFFSTISLFSFVPSELNYANRQDNQSGLDSAFTNGFYRFSFTTNFSFLSTSVSNLLATGTFPAAPNITNLVEAQAIDPSSDFTLGWNPFTGGTTGDLIVLSLQTSTGTVFRTSAIPGAAGALNGTDTSVLIPAGTLAPGRAYFGRLVFATVQSTVTNQYPGAVGATLYSGQTDFYVKTQGDGDSTPPSVAASVPADGATDVLTNTPFVVTFSEPMKTNSSAVNFTGSGSVRSVWNANGTEYGLAPALYFFTNRTQTVVLNPLPLVLFADQNGNLLPPDTLITFATGGSYYQPVAPLLVQPQCAAPGTFQTTLLGETNRGYVLQFSTNLTSWVSFATNLAFDGVIYFSDTNMATANARFYRAVAY